MMTATMYYNKAMWAAAGLTEADIPKDVGPVPRGGQKADRPGRKRRTGAGGIQL